MIEKIQIIKEFKEKKKNFKDYINNRQVFVPIIIRMKSKPTSSPKHLNSIIY